MFLEVGFGDEGAASYDDEVYDITKKPEFREQSVSTETDTLICEEIFELKKKIEVLERTNEELLYLQNKNNTSLANTKEREQQNEGNNNASSFFISLRDRSSWLVGLLVFQSCSSFILARNDALLQRHPVIVHFLTMLVGAGGNAGNQASVRGMFGFAFLCRYEYKFGIAMQCSMISCCCCCLDFLFSLACDSARICLIFHNKEGIA